MKRLFCMLCCVCLVLTGCSEMDLTDREAGMISEYAAYVVLRHNRLYSSRLQDEVYETEPETPAPIVIQPTEANEGTGSGTGTSTATEDLSMLGQALGLSDFSVKYTGYDTKSSFQDEYFNFSATPNNTLLVLHFDIINNGEQEAEANVLQNQLKFRCTVNHEKRVSSQLTMLVNDLFSFKEVIEPSQKQEAVLIFQLPVKYENAVESIELTVRDSEKSHRFMLKQD